LKDFGWEVAHGAVTRRPPIPLYTEGYTYDVGVWDWSIVQGPLSAAPCQTLGFLKVSIFNFCVVVPQDATGDAGGKRAAADVVLVCSRVEEQDCGMSFKSL
jgi:hypothetical protein